MKLTIFSALIGFSFLIFLHGSDADKVNCVKTSTCRSVKHENFEPKQIVECDECAAWGCLHEKVFFSGGGCKDDNNVCKNDNNQTGFINDAASFFTSCKQPSDLSGMCAIEQLINFTKLTSIHVTADVDCVPGNVPKPLPKLKCGKSNACQTSTYNNFEPETFSECNECAAWACYRDGVFFSGYGCKSEDNICKNGTNQDGPESHDVTSFFVSCKADIYGMCAAYKLQEYTHVNPINATAAGECIPNPSSRNPLKIKCSKKSSCKTTTFSTSEPEEMVECDQCAVWRCLRNGVLFTGSGCKGDDNICKNGANQDGDRSEDDTSLFLSCKADTIGNCASFKFYFVQQHKNFSISADGECIPNQLPPTQDQISQQQTYEEPSTKSERKNDSLKIFVIILIGLIFIGYLTCFIILF